MEDRWKRWIWILFPVLLSVYLYRRSFRIWFLNDDFAWLGLGLSVQDWRSLGEALFLPMAQGTVRTLSERLFFLVFERSFGLESLPMRLAMFATFVVALVFVGLTVKWLTGSRVAGMVAAVAWSLNFGTTVAMAWLSSYNQILLSALMMGAFYCFLRWEASGDKRWSRAMWVLYLLGFGALESVIVFPALVLWWTLLFRRERWRLSLPIAVPALLFALLHLFVIPKAKDAPAYRMYFDASLIESLGIYWNWFLGGPKLLSFSPDWEWLVRLVQWGLTPGLLGFIGWRTWKRDCLPLFGLGMSLLLLAPMLPLRDHRTDYYLASVSLGMMIVLGAMVRQWPAYAAYPLLLLYFVPGFLVQQATFEWYLERTGPLRPLMRGLQHAAKLHAGKQILVEGVSDAVYDSALADDALRLLPGANIRLAPRSGNAGLRSWDLSEEVIRAGFEKEAIVVYRFDGTKLKNVTREWEAGRALALSSGLASELRAGDVIVAGQFGRGWYGIEDGRRWMGKQATVTLGGLSEGNRQLEVSAYCPEALGEAELELWLQGERLHQGKVSPGPIEWKIELPARYARESELRLELRVSRSIRPPGDGRELSLVLGVLRVK